MSSRKDMRRPDLVIPFVEPPKEKDASGDMSGTLGSTLPMVAMFTRNKIIGWAAVVFSLQNWLAETEESKSNGGSPGYLSVGMSFMAVMVTYLPLFLPPQPKARPAVIPPST